MQLILQFGDAFGAILKEESTERTNQSQNVVDLNLKCYKCGRKHLKRECYGTSNEGGILYNKAASSKGEI